MKGIKWLGTKVTASFSKTTAEAGFAVGLLSAAAAQIREAVTGAAASATQRLSR